jgi:hypothetical protein
VLAAVVDGNPDDVVADRALLTSCLRFAKVAGGGFSGIEVDGLRGRKTPLFITPQHVLQIESLRDETPSPQAVRLAGVLDTISASRSDVILKLKDGTRVPARLDDHDPEALKDLFGKQVVVSGSANYRPTGRLLMLDVESISLAGRGSALEPSPWRGGASPSSLRWRKMSRLASRRFSARGRATRVRTNSSKRSG